MICHICGLEFSHLGLHIKQHNIDAKHYYDMYIKKPNEGICPVCGKPTTFRGLTGGYLECCSSKCSNNFNIDKIKNTKLERYGNSSYNNSEKCKNTCTSKYGVDNVLKISKNHDKGVKAAQSEESKNKRCATNLIRYGVRNVYAAKSVKDKIKQTNLARYGVEYVTKNPSIISKIKHTNLQKYGVECNLNLDSVKKKIGSKEVQIKRANSLRGKSKHSKLEQYFEDALSSLGYTRDIDYYCQYRSEEYPFMCDFYLIKSRLYIEINGYWMHGGHPFSELSSKDLQILESWSIKAKNSKQYLYAIKIWTSSDPEKRNYGRHLNFIELWNSQDIDNFINTLKEDI